MARNYLHSEDKDPDESWSAYWNRKRKERHGENCRCILCANQLDGTDWGTPSARTIDGSPLELGIDPRVEHEGTGNND
jgi:hypothetical protein